MAEDEVVKDAFRIVLSGEITNNDKEFADARVRYHNCEYQDMVDIEEGFIEASAAFFAKMLAKAKERIAKDD